HLLCPPSLLFFNDTPTTELYTLSLHDALPISAWVPARLRPGCRGTPRGIHRSTTPRREQRPAWECRRTIVPRIGLPVRQWDSRRSEEHTSELQSLAYLVCRLLLEKKKKQNQTL